VLGKKKPKHKGLLLKHLELQDQQHNQQPLIKKLLKTLRNLLLKQIQLIKFGELDKIAHNGHYLGQRQLRED
jgi:hypothetical protein